MNPFELDVLDKNDYDNNELREIQKKLTEKQENEKVILKEKQMLMPILNVSKVYACVGV